MFKCNKQVVAVVRSFGLGVLALAVLVGLTVSAQQPQQLAQPVTVIKIVPEKPSPNDEIKIELSGTFPNACAPDSAEAQVELNQVTIRTSNVSAFCAEGETKWSLSVPVGKKLEAGPYRVLVLFSMTKESPDLLFLLGMARFDVAEKSGSADQVGQPSPLVPFTILPVVQTLDGMRAVPSCHSGTTGTINTSKSNTFRVGNVVLPATGGVTKGDVVTLGINTSKNNVYRIVGCKAEDAQVKDNCIPPFRPEKPTKLEITGDNPIFSYLFEQIEPPDLAVNIRATVRRYTEREQVFCDITVLTTVSNRTRGNGGAIVFRTQINTSKSNVYRYGMGDGGNATQVDLLSRLRPGQYPLEAEAQSLSFKEDNLANNRAAQVAVCR